MAHAAPGTPGLSERSRMESKVMTSALGCETGGKAHIRKCTRREDNLYGRHARDSTGSDSIYDRDACGAKMSRKLRSPLRLARSVNIPLVGRPDWDETPAGLALRAARRRLRCRRWVADSRVGRLAVVGATTRARRRPTTRPHSGRRATSGCWRGRPTRTWSPAVGALAARAEMARAGGFLRDAARRAGSSNPS